MTTYLKVASVPLLAHAEEAHERLGVGAVGAQDDGIDVDATQQAIALAPRLLGLLGEGLAHARVTGVDQNPLAALGVFQLDEADVRQIEVARVVDDHADDVVPA